MDMDPELLKKLLITLNDELNEEAENMTHHLLNIEKNEAVDTAITSIFRSAHNIKGAARGVGVKDVGEIAHHIETIFANIQNKSIKITSDIVNLCLEAIDDMRISLQAYMEEKPIPFDLNQLLSRLSGNSPLNKIIKIELPAPTNTPKPMQNQRLNIKKQESLRVAIENLDKVSALTEEIQVTKIAIDENYSELIKLNERSKQLKHSFKDMGAIIQNTSQQIEQTIQQVYNNIFDEVIEMGNHIDSLNKNMRRHINELTTLSHSLLEEVRTLRLIPASTLFSTFTRTVRDIAQELNKKVEINIMGDSVKMDKIVLDELKDPIIHLLRNAIDHGIESPDSRQSKGKEPIGHIHINIHEQGDQIFISLSDDG